MKKIVAVAALASLLGGATFAADLSFDYTGSGIFGTTTKKVNTVDMNNCFALELKSDVAGVHLDWDIDDSNTKADSSKLVLDQFYAWMSFGLPVGNLQITSGKWVSRYVSRLNDDQGDLDGDYFEQCKPGVINGAVAIDSDNLTLGNMASVLAYTIDELPGKLMLKAGMVGGGTSKVNTNSGNVITSGSYNTEASATDGIDFRCGWVAEACYNQEGLIKINAAFRSLTIKEKSFGIFLSPLMVENFNAMAGFSMGLNGADEDNNEIGVDLRARYALNEKLSITGMFNFSQTKINKNVNNEDLKSLWAMGAVSYVAGDNIRFIASLKDIVTDTAAEYGARVTSFTPACEIKGSEKVTVTTAVDFTWDNSGATGVKPFAGTCDITIPVYVHVAL